jgi:hypothetical protein
MPALVSFSGEIARGEGTDREVLRERLVMEAARAKEQAIAQADRGEFAEARLTMSRCTGSIRGRLQGQHRLTRSDVALLGAEAGLCDQLFAGFSRDRYDALSRKRAILQTMRAKKQRGVYRK